MLNYIHLGEMNSRHFELYALLDKAYSSGLPLGFLLLQSDSSTKGRTECVLQEFLHHFTDKLKVNTTLSDKNFSKINSLCAEFPDVKHQLCYWHALCVVKMRLSILQQGPVHNDIESACKEFEWIDEDFVPVGQSRLSAKVSINNYF
jgi:hypothetical protein